MTHRPKNMNTLQHEIIVDKFKKKKKINDLMERCIDKDEVLIWEWITSDSNIIIIIREEGGQWWNN